MSGAWETWSGASPAAETDWSSHDAGGLGLVVSPPGVCPNLHRGPLPLINVVSPPPSWTLVTPPIHPTILSHADIAFLYTYDNNQVHPVIISCVDVAVLSSGLSQCPSRDAVLQ